MKKVSDLVCAGKYAEAQQGVAALLILYPDDLRLIKAKALLDKTLAPSQPAEHSSVSAVNPTPELAEPAVQNSANINKTASLAPAPAFEPAGHNFAVTDNPASESAGSAPHASTAKANSAPLSAAENTAVLHIYRPHHLVAAAQKPDIYIDGKKITPIANSQVIRMLLLPGKHNISVSKKYIENEIPINDLDIVAGNEYWIRVDISAAAFGAHSKLYLVSSDQALLESKRMEEIKLGDVSSN